jgi:hypothetical protein
MYITSRRRPYVLRLFQKHECQSNIVGTIILDVLPKKSLLIYVILLGCVISRVFPVEHEEENGFRIGQQLVVTVIVRREGTVGVRYPVVSMFVHGSKSW